MSIPLRLEKLRETFNEKELDAILISGPDNRRYLSGFTGSAGYLLVSQAEAVLATDFRYVQQASQQAPQFRVERVSGGLDWLPQLASEVGASRVGFESQQMTVGAHSAFQKAISESDEAEELMLVETSDTVDEMRATKYEEEAELLIKAIEITDQAFEEVSSTIEAGVTEGKVAWQLEKAMRERGAEGLAFEIIVGAGPNGALPHHLADDTVIESGQPVVIDMGAKYQGYCADLTRTIVVGEPDEKFMRIYDTVLRAQVAAEAGVRPGMTGADVDTIARDIIAEAGHDEEFGHSLGHGCRIGGPRASPRRPKSHRRLGRGYDLYYRARYLPARMGRSENRGHRGIGERWSPGYQQGAKAGPRRRCVTEMSIGYGDLRKGLAIELEGEPHVVVEYKRSKMQQRAPVMRVRFRSLRSGRIVDRTFQGYDVKLTPAAVERRTAQYIYEDGGLYYFMDTESFDQLPMSSEQVEEALPYLVEQVTVDLVLYQDEPISIELPVTVDLKVAETDPGFKGDTAQGGTKQATLETGLAVQVPLFVDAGDKVRVDTRTGQYMARA